jgi:hypothetical protein
MLLYPSSHLIGGRRGGSGWLGRRGMEEERGGGWLGNERRRLVGQIGFTPLLYLG